MLTLPVTIQNSDVYQISFFPSAITLEEGASKDVELRISPAPTVEAFKPTITLSNDADGLLITTDEIIFAVGASSAVVTVMAVNDEDDQGGDKQYTVKSTATASAGMPAAPNTPNLSLIHI